MFSCLEEYVEKNKLGTIVAKFTLPRVGWEMDNYFVVVKREKEPSKIVTTDHGGAVVEGLGPVLELLRETKQLVHDAEEALRKF